MITSIYWNFLVINFYPEMARTLCGPRSIEVRPSKFGGYGVFARADISKGEILEECYYLPLTAPWECTDPGLKKYVFMRSRSPASGQFKAAAVLGYGMIYNHSRPANVNYTKDVSNKIFTFTAVKKISKNKELFIDYGTASLSASEIRT